MQTASDASIEQTKPRLLDDDSRKVPDMGGSTANSSAHTTTKTRGGGKRRAEQAADKEHKRMKRLLRNRVSAQQARERKKAYLSELEVRIKELEQMNALLEEKVSTLQQENGMLRKVIRSSTTLRNENSEG